MGVQKEISIKAMYPCFQIPNVPSELYTTENCGPRFLRASTQVCAALRKPYSFVQSQLGHIISANSKVHYGGPGSIIFHSTIISFNKGDQTLLSPKITL